MWILHSVGSRQFACVYFHILCERILVEDVGTG